MHWRVRASVSSTVVCLKPLGTVRVQDGPSAGGVAELTGLTGPRLPPTGEAGHPAGGQNPRNTEKRRGSARSAAPSIPQLGRLARRHPPENLPGAVKTCQQRKDGHPP